MNNTTYITGIALYTENKRIYQLELISFLGYFNCCSHNGSADIYPVIAL